MIGIYKITNKINGKAYVGQSVNIETRWLKHRKDTHNHDLRNDINNYGLENFIFEVLELCELEQLNERERYWIKHYNTYEQGYNLTLGGDADTNPLNLDYDMVYEEYLKTNSMAETAKKFNCSVTPVRNAVRQHGIDRSNEEKEKPVEQIDPHTLEVVATFSSISEAGRAIGISGGAISRVINGHGVSAAGYYWRLVGDTETKFKPIIKQWKKQIIQCDRDTEEPLQVFSSAAEAAAFLGKDRKNGGSHITAACSGRKQTAYGYKWKYAK